MGIESNKVRPSKEHCSAMCRRPAPLNQSSCKSYENFTYGDIYTIGNLDDKTRELVTLVVLTTNQTLPQIKAHTHAALNVGVSPIEMREALYHVAASSVFRR